MRNITVGIDVGTHATRVVVGEYLKDEPLPAIVGLGSSPSQGLRHGYIISKADARKSIRKAIDEAQRQAKVKRNSELARKALFYAFHCTTV